MRTKTVALIALIAVVVIGLGTLAYVLTDKYGGRHLAAAVASSTESSSAEDPLEVTASEPASSDAASSDAASSEADSSGGTLATTGSSAGTTGDNAEDVEGGEYTATDTSYVSDTVAITISEVTTGEGEDKITYFVADVQVSSPAALQSALAQNVSAAGTTLDTSAIAEASGAILAVNGDYYSARDDGIIIRNGVILRDIPTRMGLAIYSDGGMEVYDETATSAQELLAEGVWNTYSFGPALLIDGVVGGNLETVEGEPNAKHGIQGSQPRTGIGYIEANHYVLVVVDGRSPGYSRGVTLTEFAQIFQELGCATAYNLDGGGSSTLYFMGDVVNDPLGRDSERAVSDILMVK